MRRGSPCSKPGGRRFKSCPRYQRVNGITAGQRPASSACGPFSCVGQVCVLTRSLTRVVSGVPRRLTWMRCIETIEGDQDRSGTGRQRSPGTISGRSRVRRRTAGSRRAGWERASRWSRHLAKSVTVWSGSPSVTGVFAKAPESGSSFGSYACDSFVTSELGNRAHCAVPGQALRAASTCGVVANGVRHGEQWTVDKIITGR